ncbi:TolC family protein [Neorhodopirellula pilleata]|uniref:Outer membrane efflux protein n=1 Tax=Neorhodopirellula pilleata TaxID=2714738 RepID=A0A5C6AVJ1_9BACT|nr:TolC family protein [Neorhodopirellula pilleata]TWU03608.1 Outer membrane efflux protein [Neorhodopirellula pilleata]
MDNRTHHLLVIALTIQMIGGCGFHSQKVNFREACSPGVPLHPSCGPQELRPADADVECCVGLPMMETISPLDIDEESLSPQNTIPLTVDDCLRYALENSRVVRDLGGALLRSPDSVVTRFDPALQYSNAQTGEQAALSAFDANLFASALFEKNDRELNNRFFGNQGVFLQDLHNYELGVRKRSATGGLMTLRQQIVYDNNNQLSNGFGPNTYDNIVDAEIRHPLMQGAGTQFNRIAGPGASVGQLNGVLISRVRTDISLSEFEKAVIDLLADVENAYWDLYYAYRDLEAKIDARDIAKDTLKRLPKNATSSGDVAQAEEQVFRFEAEIIDALNGRAIDGTRTNNGSSGGTFRAIGGLRFQERKLRLIMGMPINDGQLIRPAEAPTDAPVTYDWNASIAEALHNRPELKRQEWIIKQRQLELTANRNFLKPQLDLIGRYRFRGFGDRLLDDDSVSNATASLLSGDMQEWQVGVEYQSPVGFRRAHAAVRNSQIALKREVNVLQEQQRSVHFGLSNTFNELKRAFDNMTLQKQRVDAIIRQLNALETKAASGDNPALDVRLETHRRLLDARLRFHQAQIEYAMAIRNVHFEKGTLLTYCNVSLSESAPTVEAYRDAAVVEESRRVQYAPAHRDPVVGKNR